MKKLAILVGCLLAGSLAMAQGTILFNNGTPNGTAPVLGVDGSPLPNTGYLAQLWAGPSADSLAPIGATAGFVGNGIFLGQGRTVDTVAPGDTAYFSVRVWNDAFASWDAAYAAFGSGDASAEIGWSNGGDVLTITTGGGGVPAAPPADMVVAGLTGFQLQVVPEPSTIALGLLAGLAFIIRRRK